jgi:hypothetical protein
MWYMGRSGRCAEKDSGTALMSCRELAAAIPEVERLRRKMRQWPPIQSGEEKYQKGLGGVMAEEMGWVD